MFPEFCRSHGSEYILSQRFKWFVEAGLGTSLAYMKLLLCLLVQLQMFQVHICYCLLFLPSNDLAAPYAGQVAILSRCEENPPWRTERIMISAGVGSSMVFPWQYSLEIFSMIYADFCNLLSCPWLKIVFWPLALICKTNDHSVVCSLVLRYNSERTHAESKRRQHMLL